MLILLFALGAATGSFIYCTAFRLSYPTAQNKQWWNGRSQCDNCQRQLLWWQIVPLIGWLVQRGRCYFCQSTIGWKSTLLEFSIGIFTSVYFSKLLNYGILLWLVLITLLFSSLTDYWQKQIYWLPFVPTGLIGLSQRWPFEFRNPNIWLLVVFLCLVLLIIRITGSLGIGDLDLFIYWACFFSLTTILTATLLGCLYALLHNWHNPETHRIPFVPYLSVGLLSTLVYQFM